MRHAIAAALADDWRVRYDRHRAATAVAAFARYFFAEEPEDDRCG